MEIVFTAEQVAKLLDTSVSDLKDFQNTEGEVENSDQIVSRILDRMSNLIKEGKDEGYKIGERKKGEAIEKALEPIFRKLNISGSGKAEDLISELETKISESSGKPGDEEDLTLQQIEKHPHFQTLLNERLDKVVSERDTAINELQEFKQRTQFEKKKSAAIEQARKMLLERGAPAESVDKRAELIFLSNGYDNIQMGEEGSLVVADADGNPLRRADSSRVTLENLVIDTYQELGFKFSEGTGGNPERSKARSNGGNSIQFSSREEFESKLKTAKPGEKADLLNAWAEQLATGENPE